MVYRKIMIDSEVDLCDYYKDPESHVNLDKIIPTQNSSLHSGCPYRVCYFYKRFVRNDKNKQNTCLQNSMYMLGLYIKFPDFLDVGYSGQWRLDIHLSTMGKQRKDTLVIMQIYFEVKVI